MRIYGECDFCQGTMDNCPYCKRPISDNIKGVDGKPITPKELDEMYDTDLDKHS